jgi:hypothetical protein
MNKIHEAIETKQYCSAALLDISQAFDKVWHTGLQYKLRQSLPLNYFLLLKSYLYYRQFGVKVGKLNLSNKLLIYKVVIKPIWTYGIQLCGAASTSNIEILERYQSKALHSITNASWYVPNAIIRCDLKVPSAKEQIRRLSAQYYTGLCTNSNHLATLISRPHAFRRLRRHLPSDLPHRFTV